MPRARFAFMTSPRARRHERPPGEIEPAPGAPTPAAIRRAALLAILSLAALVAAIAWFLL